LTPGDAPLILDKNAWQRGPDRLIHRLRGEACAISIRTPLAGLILSLGATAAAWGWLAQPAPLARPPISPATKLECVSYAPFRGAQNPLDSSIRIPAEQIAQDLAQLARITGCIRTYSIDNGLDQIPALAQKAGLKVIHGLWLSSDRAKNRNQIDVSVALARDYPGVITSIVVGNEVLLRGEMTAAELAGYIRNVKSRVRIPVTYADVWEFWLRHREVFDAVDFVTIHILPYWEDFPIKAQHAAAHVDSIRRRMVAAFPNKEILIGETGWPSAGRMREGALPSRANQARVVSDILALAQRDRFRVNLIEAYDQPWKRQLEGTVGGYWGLIGDNPRDLKYPPGQPVRDFPLWQWQAGGGMLFCLAVFAVAIGCTRRKPWSPRLSAWTAVTVTATAGGILVGIAAEKMWIESLNPGAWVRWGTLFAAAIAASLLGARALVAGQSLPTFLAVLGPREQRTRDAATLTLGLALIVTCLVATEVALGLVFDARYRDFPFAALTVAVVPLLGLSLLDRPRDGARPIAEQLFALLLACAAVYTAFNEGIANWQALWTCGAFVALALTLWRARDGQTRES
jgi:glucan 1,3-beta-glucosidase